MGPFGPSVCQALFCDEKPIDKQFITEEDNGNPLCIVRNKKKNDMQLIKAYPTEKGLKKVGFNNEELHGILGDNWFNFYKDYIN